MAKTDLNTRPRSDTSRLRLVARRWMRSRNRSHPLTFERVCEAFAMDAVRLRARVLSLCGRKDTPGRFRPRVDLVVR